MNPHVHKLWRFLYEKNPASNVWRTKLCEILPWFRRSKSFKLEQKCHNDGHHLLPTNTTIFRWSLLLWLPSIPLPSPPHALITPLSLPPDSAMQKTYQDYIYHNINVLTISYSLLSTVVQPGVWTGSSFSTSLRVNSNNKGPSRQNRTVTQKKHRQLNKILTFLPSISDLYLYPCLLKSWRMKILSWSVFCDTETSSHILPLDYEFWQG